MPAALFVAAWAREGHADERQLLLYFSARYVSAGWFIPGINIKKKQKGLGQFFKEMRGLVSPSCPLFQTQSGHQRTRVRGPRPAPQNIPEKSVSTAQKGPNYSGWSSKGLIYHIAPCPTELLQAHDRH